MIIHSLIIFSFPSSSYLVGGDAILVGQVLSRLPDGDRLPAHVRLHAALARPHDGDGQEGVADVGPGKRGGEGDHEGEEESYLRAGQSYEVGPQFNWTLRDTRN